LILVLRLLLLLLLLLSCSPSFFLLLLLCFLPALGSLGLRRFLVAGARKFLEKQYADFVKQAVAQDRREAQLGGKLGFERHVRAFLTIYPHLLPNGGQFPAGAEEPDCDANGLPIWPQLYFCLRCGKEVAALRIARQNSAVLGNFAAFLQEYINQISPGGDADVGASASPSWCCFLLLPSASALCFWFSIAAAAAFCCVVCLFVCFSIRSHDPLYLFRWRFLSLLSLDLSLSLSLDLSLSLSTS
jgi:Nup93/Nic96